jgi:hypothetical protein
VPRIEAQVRCSARVLAPHRFISLRMINAHVDYNSRFPAGYTAGLRLLRLAARTRADYGRQAVGPLYEAIGTQAFDSAAAPALGPEARGTRACGWTPRTGSGCRTGSVSGPGVGVEGSARRAVDEELTPRQREVSSRSWSTRFCWRLPGVAALDAYGSASLVLRAGNDGFRARPLWHQPSYCPVASRGMTGFRDHRPGSRPLDRSRDLKGEAPAGRAEADRAIIGLTIPDGICSPCPRHLRHGHRDQPDGPLSAAVRCVPHRDARCAAAGRRRGSRPVSTARR